MHLFFDTETTGLPRSHHAPVTDLDNWPRLVQLAWLLVDETGREVTSAEHIIRPEGFEIPAEAAWVHGITTERALAEGVELTSVLEGIEASIQEASVLVAHNISFDEKVLGAEFLRSGLGDPLTTKPRLCTMKASTRFCQIPGPYGYKWPSLTELHHVLFGEPFENAHNALADVRACARSFYALRSQGIIA